MTYDEFTRELAHINWLTMRAISTQDAQYHYVARREYEALLRAMRGDDDPRVKALEQVVRETRSAAGADRGGAGS